MSQTYLAAITQFVVVMGVLNQADADALLTGLISVVALGNLLWTLWGRFRAGGITKLGTRL